ncbi:MAG: hypothetical protein BGO93_21310 [Mesorhizobium sp. 65-26]|jgi:hypothetical protein|uniref:hypothetical protein n=1 Tax=unclassified Mesorhizobium TaxID=325217 RepID=UPI00096060B0|nr:MULTISPECIES: hypothetical protein [unclassified Mesorhizobium]MBN9259103.1 hypothetical protein [Mesorhizobium sp.]OJX72366.1 MAG: hypothetical protein BGO93_21310 [Mesorhizobium sp. 65-26]
MSRYTITVTGKGRSDSDAIIGYDPPLRTFFLQAFPHEVTDDPALWLGTYDREYDTLAALHAATLKDGYDFMPLPNDVAVQIAADKAAGDGRAKRLKPIAKSRKHLDNHD